LAPSRARAATDFWNTGSGNWNTALNWTSGVPTAGKDVYIVESDSVDRVVSYDYGGATMTLNSLTLDNLGAGTNTLAQAAQYLNVTTEFIGATGRAVFSQSGGSNIAKNLYLGFGPAATATYTLAGGASLLTSTGGFIGGGSTSGGGTALFNQTGGTHIVGVSGTSPALSIGYNKGSGTYMLSDGVLTVGTLQLASEYVGSNGAGVFNQSGGIHTIGSSNALGSGGLFIGTFGGNGTYTLSGGALNVYAGSVSSGNEIIGSGGNGVFNQSGGSHTVGAGSSSALIVGAKGGNGTLTLGAGSLNIGGHFDVGGDGTTHGTGVVVQNGGVVKAGDWLSVGEGGTDGVHSSGTYYLNAGTITLGLELTISDFSNSTGAFYMTSGNVSASALAVGNWLGDSDAVGLLVQGGGTIQIASTIHVAGVGANSAGTYQLLGGVLASTSGSYLSLQTRGAFIVATNAVISGLGTFAQSGGVATIPGTLTIDPSGTAAFTSYSFTGGTATIGSLTGSSGTAVIGSTSGATLAKLGVGRFDLGSLRVETGGRITVSGGPPRASNSVGTLTMTGNATLDLADSTLATSTPADTIKSYLARAYTANADWSGPGLTSGLARQNPVTYSVGYAASSDQSAIDAGIIVAPGQVLVTPTLTGDANLDGKVDFFDITQLLGYKYNTGQPASYTDGDLNYDGVVDFFDLTVVLSANYNSGQTFGAAALSAAESTGDTNVPEPAQVAAIGCATLLVAHRRRRITQRSTPQSSAARAPGK
jgi:hypothetical protein